MEKFEDSQRYPKTLQPNTLDIVRIDGRWAQTTSEGTDEGVIVFLDDRSSKRINWDDYRLENKFKSVTVRDLKDIFTEEEIKNVHWGSEQKEHPYLKELVKVFGEYVKK